MLDLETCLDNQTDLHFYMTKQAFLPQLKYTSAFDLCAQMKGYNLPRQDTNC